MTAQEIVMASLGFGGLLLSGWTQYLSYKSRTASYRSKLYEEQAKLYPELLTVLHICLLEALTFSAMPNNDEVQTAWKAHRAMNDYVVRHSHILPEAVVAQSKTFLLRASVLIGCHKGSGSDPEAVRGQQELAKIGSDLVSTLRYCMGVESLTQETLKLFNTHTDYMKGLKE